MACSRILCTTLAVGAMATWLAATARGVVLAEFNFDNPGNPTENLGAGPDGVLLGGANVVGGQLAIDGPDQALDIPLGALSPFGGQDDWLVAFDFATTGLVESGALFSSDGSPDGGFPGGQDGSLNIFLDGGSVVLDFWFIGAIGTEDAYNDDALHSVEAFYEAETGIVTLTVDEEEVFNDEEPWFYERDATADRTLVGDETNADFGIEFNPDGFFGVFDNVVIDAPAPPPVVLNINRDTGRMTFESISVDPITMTDLSITSAAGSLDPGQWLSTADNYDADSGGSVDANDNWMVTAATEFELAENDGGGDGATLTNGQMIDLGEGLWRPSPIQDVGVELFETGLGDFVRGAVAYTGDEVIFGDLDLDGDVDPADWDLFVAGYGSDLSAATPLDAYFQADLDADGEHTSDDFVEFVFAFDDFNGVGAFASIVGASAPEPSAIVLAALGAAAATVVQLRLRGKSGALVLATIAAASLTPFRVNADLLVEYTFESDFQDSSGNGRTGVPAGLLGGEPIVLNGLADFSGIPLSYLEVPLGPANPFDGSQDFTIELTFNSLGADFTGGGVILLGSADAAAPTEPDGHSMSVFIEPHEEEDGDVFGGSLVYDNYFVGEVRVDDALLLDGEDHTVRITYVAPEDLEEPGRMFINLDDEWVARGEIGPDVPDIANHTVTLGSTLNEDFPFECEEGECFTQEFVGAMDNVRIFDDAQAPTELRAAVDRGTGEISLLGGEFEEEIRFYEIRSEAASLNPAGWNSLSDQDVDAEGGNSGESWDELAAAADRLAEGFLLGASFFDDGRNVSLGNGYDTSVDGQDLEIEVVNADLDSLLLAIEYTGEPPTDVVGDYNGNGTVEQADLDLVLLNWGAAFDTLPAEWINERPIDGIVDQAELDGVLLNWGSAAGGLAGAGVPEPTSWTLGLLSAIVFGARHSRRRSQA